MSRKKIRALGYFAAFSIFEVYYLSVFFPFSSYLYLLLQASLVALCFLSDSNRLKVSLFEGGIILFVIVEYVATILNKVPLIPITRNTIQLFAFLLWAKVGMKLNVKDYFHTNASTLLFLTLINTLSAIITYPNALYYDGPSPLFLLGGDNTSVRIYLLAIAFCLLHEQQNGQGKFYATALACINLGAFVFLRDIGTGKLCFVVMLLGIFFFVIKKNALPKNIVLWIAVFHLFLFIVLVILNRTDLFSFIIIRFLHRQLTLTERFIIWRITLDKIIENPIIGYGYVSGATFESMLPSIIGVNAHNTFLMIVYIGGVLLFSAFIVVFLIAQNKYDKVGHNKQLAILPITLFALMLRAQVEGADTIWIFYLLYLMYNYNRIEGSFPSARINDEL